MLLSGLAFICACKFELLGLAVQSISVRKPLVNGAATARTMPEVRPTIGTGPVPLVMVSNPPLTWTSVRSPSPPRIDDPAILISLPAGMSRTRAPVLVLMETVPSGKSRLVDVEPAGNEKWTVLLAQTDV